ncbi:hypothetical protein [Clostridium septicum]|uniref:Lipoprotein n=1 Tax=Clostridium septicum TaxID=1504 RepID=A0A9N7JN19_CLOSE|nr:hypothetical protein [Clostridium septicum]AYE35335.1 hypothetical protein CP523_13365 [Clostridium septicum]MDU1314847.1 hypothetical protein [Clostridium septicum]QAS60726.1 hypothetical protein EI377_08255 [Clostridium septicum]UEC20009.1 hypothetical protein LK444_11410 [Clostridium septicum]USS01933.1 hypothetical protein NH397_05760 [Clostridium septicum]
MKMKKLSLLVATLALTVGLAGCMPGSNAKLPEGDVKVAKQEIQGVVDLLLKSADYGKDESTVASILLPQDSQYNINVVMEKYKDGKLVDTKEITNYTTEKIEKNSIVHMILNVGKASDGENSRSIYSIAEVDKEKTKDEKNPEYKLTKINEHSLDYDVKSEVAQIGKNLDEEVTLAGYVKFKEDDTEKPAINLDTYKDEVSKYKEVSIVKMKVTKK